MTIRDLIKAGLWAQIAAVAAGAFARVAVDVYRGELYPIAFLIALAILTMIIPKTGRKSHD